MRDVSEESLLDYFHSNAGNSGRVRNADILKTFKPFIGHSDLQLRAKYREEFKLIIDRIAVVKSENGEKYLILKKKYRHLLQERDAKRQGSDADQPRHTSPTRTTATAEWETTDGLTHLTHQQDERLATVQHPQQGGDQHNGEDELGSDSGSKSESEHDEESTGSMGSASVALDPTEKEWIYSAASARVPELLKLLVQDPSLANKKDFTSVSTALHWAAKHGNEDMMTLVADAGADVNLKSHVSSCFGAVVGMVPRCRDAPEGSLWRSSCANCKVAARPVRPWGSTANKSRHVMLIVSQNTASYVRACTSSQPCNFHRITTQLCFCHYLVFP
uniref:SOWAHA-C winged helix-turn-helix domain-containing protein n=1 Tax=Oryzias latipes TaxID=8090 RepID=A0A3P9KE94_ORYLA